MNSGKFYVNAEKLSTIQTDNLSQLVLNFQVDVTDAIPEMNSIVLEITPTALYTFVLGATTIGNTMN